jgi:hypothetical protein
VLETSAYLAGDCLSTADITFAALVSIILSGSCTLKLNVELVIYHSQHYPGRRISAPCISFIRLVFSSQSFSARITSYEGRATCFTIVQGGTILWKTSSEAEKEFARIMVITATH